MTTTSPASRHPLITILLPMILAVAAGAVGKAPPPDILVFLTDDLSRRDLTVYGATDVRTPVMQQLADAGLTFDRAFIASPACAPSRAAMLTGLMPARNGAEGNHTYKRDGVASLPPELGALGYEIAAFGKVAHGKSDPVRHGFDHIDPKYDRATVAAWLTQRDAGRPLCLFVGTHQPHVLWPENDGYDPAELTLPPFHIDTPDTREHRARYYTDVTIADTEFGEIHELAREVLGAETLVIFTSDHGAQWPFGKWTLYDEGIRVPFIAAWPRRIAPGVRSDAMISWIDLLPTLIDLAGGSAPDNIDGRSFAAVLLGETDTHRDRIFTTHNNDKRMNVYPIRSVRTDTWKYIHNLHPDWLFTTHTDQLRRDGAGAWFTSWETAAKDDAHAASLLSRYRRRPAEELYDLRNDPDELHNLAAEPAHAAVMAELRAELDVWRASQGDTGMIDVEPVTTIPPGPTGK